MKNNNQNSSPDPKFPAKVGGLPPENCYCLTNPVFSIESESFVNLSRLQSNFLKIFSKKTRKWKDFPKSQRNILSENAKLWERNTDYLGIVYQRGVKYVGRFIRQPEQ